MSGTSEVKSDHGPLKNEESTESSGPSVRSRNPNVLDQAEESTRWHYRPSPSSISQIVLTEDLFREFGGRVDNCSAILNLATEPVTPEKFWDWVDQLAKKHEAKLKARQLGFRGETTFGLYRAPTWIAGIEPNYALYNGKLLVSSCGLGVTSELGKFPSGFTQAFLEFGFKLVGEDDTRDIHVNFIFPSSNGVQRIYKEFPPLFLDTIKGNYSEKVVEQTREVLRRLKDHVNGLIILHGPVGTGKTFLLRAILTELKKIREGLICSPPLHFFQYAMDLAQAIAPHDKSLVIMEDIGDVFTLEGKSRHVDASSNLFNLTDGLLSMLGSAVFLLSFNYDVGKIDPALMRPGRCIAKIEIDLLPKAQAQKLTGMDLQHDEYSLAEVYEIRATHQDVVREARIGFATPR